MLSKAKISLIRSLGQKKFRHEHQLFVVEGAKMLAELAKSNFKATDIFVTDEFYMEYPNLFRNSDLVSKNELSRISFLTSAFDGLAIVQIPNKTTLFEPNSSKFYLALDGIRDPGNLGTIIRTADWFGITDIICSNDTTDCFNPKSIQASMGSIFRVNIHYLDLTSFLKSQKNRIPIFGADTNGESVFDLQNSNGIVVIGNEANGIRDYTKDVISKCISIPKINSDAESLNASVATAIICSEFTRKHK